MVQSDIGSGLPRVGVSELGYWIVPIPNLRRVRWGPGKTNQTKWSVGGVVRSWYVFASTNDVDKLALAPIRVLAYA